ncbi:hypothetical protein XJ32_10575 [Helicobacter bilis]|uniref:CASTOR ACT domain-containing protein n=1 Tax=Helicobacter bilis TaxID=37372 RepID=A0A1Q2LIX6_9HELI|nr:ACT domain-containing protein [Helicobacter bilis]AQQ60454.1 hypothetical protein XJ32_10575 [Helicobacter bilis]
MNLKLCNETFIIKRVDKNLKINLNNNIFCIVNEFDCLSLIEFASEHNTDKLKFRAFYIDNIFDFSQSGVLFEVLKPLKENNISVLVISAFSRDYIFVNELDYENAKNILKV